VKRWVWLTIEYGLFTNLLTTFHSAIEQASPWVRRYAALIPNEGRVLDLACGSGRHSKFLTESSYSVVGVDKDVRALESLAIPGLIAQQADLELVDWPLVGELFAGIVVTNYLFRPHLDQLPKMLIDGGVLIYETFAQGNAQFGKPSNPNFLLKPGELLDLAGQNGLKVIGYEDIYVDLPKPAMIQRLCAVKGDLNGLIPLQFQG